MLSFSGNDLLLMVTEKLNGLVVLGLHDSVGQMVTVKMELLQTLICNNL